MSLCFNCGNRHLPSPCLAPIHQCACCGYSGHRPQYCAAARDTARATGRCQNLAPVQPTYFGYGYGTRGSGGAAVETLGSSLVPPLSAIKVEGGAQTPHSPYGQGTSKSAAYRRHKKEKAREAQQQQQQQQAQPQLPLSTTPTPLQEIHRLERQILQLQHLQQRQQLQHQQQQLPPPRTELKQEQELPPPQQRPSTQQLHPPQQVHKQIPLRLLDTWTREEVQDLIRQLQ